LPPCPRVLVVGKMGGWYQSPPLAPLNCACAQPVCPFQLKSKFSRHTSKIFEKKLELLSLAF